MPADPNQIVQQSLYVKPWITPAMRRLPGVNPLPWSDWIIQDETYAEQMAYRDELVATKRDIVFAAHDDAQEASQELLDMVLSHISASEHGYEVTDDHVLRPDGVKVNIHADHPLISAGRLVQQDFCLLHKHADEHVLTGAILCFPSNWRLTEKMGKPMSGIHEPVRAYDANIAKRVQRIFDNVKPDNPVWRANYLLYATANLHQPNRETPATEATGKYVRVERQSLVCLPKSGALVFGIHSHVVPIGDLSTEDRASFMEAWKTSHHAEVNARG